MKETQAGKAIAPVVDIFPQLAVGFHDQQRVDEEMRMLNELGFERVYFVLCNPGYPTFSNPILCLQPADVPGFENYSARSIEALVDPNRAYVEACHRHGMEAFAILKPYEGGGGATIPHGAQRLGASYRHKTIGGERIGFDTLLSRRPDLAVQRRPIPGYAERVNQPVCEITLRFCLDKIEGEDKSGNPLAATAPVRVHLFTSSDNGSYTRYDRELTVREKIESLVVRDANGFVLDENLRRCRVISLSGFEFESGTDYFAVVLECEDVLYTIPYSMITLHGAQGEIPSTVTPYIRQPGNSVEKNKPPHERVWGMEQIPAMALNTESALAQIPEWGFEFDWYGSGFWGPGWNHACGYGIARGKLLTMKGTPCEGYPEVRNAWCDWVRDCIDMGFDGVDLRLQNHSGMVSDFAWFGYNAPLVERYREKFGINICDKDADPLELMAVRGEFFTEFVETAAKQLHSAGRKLQIHLRHCHEAPKLSSDFNELGFWAMPKVWLKDWKKLVDLADEITLKDYHFSRYRPELAQQTKAYALKQGKRVWVHCYISQGGELNENYLRQVEEDSSVGGILLYEVAHSQKNEHNVGLIEQYGPVGWNAPVVDELKRLLKGFGYATEARV